MLGKIGLLFVGYLYTQRNPNREQRVYSGQTIIAEE